MSFTDDFPLVSGLSSHLAMTANSDGPSGFAIAGEEQWAAICREAERLRAEARARQRDIAVLTRMLHGDSTN